MAQRMRAFSSGNPQALPSPPVLRMNSRRMLKVVVMVQAAESLMGNDAPSGQETVTRHVGAPFRIIRHSRPRAECGRLAL